MSATSEELAAQAEQLQDTIAYFRIENIGQAPTTALAKTNGRASAATPITFSQKQRKASTPTRVKAPALRAASIKPVNGQGRNDGFALDLASGGGDARDGEFERSRADCVLTESAAQPERRLSH